MNYGSTDKLRELIDAKHACLVRLRDFGAEQSWLIHENDMTTLLEVLAAKQDVITELRDVEQRLDPFRSESPQDRVWRSETDRAECAAIAEACRALLDEVVAMEKANENNMVACRDSTAARLATAHAANRARTAYAAQQGYASARDR